jgi:hypothetical protein
MRVHDLDVGQRGPGQREQAMVHAQLDLADDRQLVLQQEIVVAVDAAADGVLHGQDAVGRAAAVHGGEDLFEGRAGKNGSAGRIFECGGFAIRAGFPLKRYEHSGIVD